jgi:signal transduction histidine kinase
VGPPETRKIPVLFAVATLLPIAALCWLSMWTLEQDRALEGQRRLDRLEVIAARVMLEIEQDLQLLEAKLASGGGIRFRPRSIATDDAQPLLFRPDLPSVSVLSPPQLTEADQHEERQPLRSIETYRRIAADGGDPNRGEALMRLGGLLRRLRRFDDALRAYAALEGLGAQPVAGGQPAVLVAKEGRAKTFLESGDRARLREEAVALARALNSGGWLIDRLSFEMYQHDMIEAWGGPPADRQAFQRADAVAELWRLWQRGDLPSRDRRFVSSREPAALAVWVAGSEGPVLAILTSEQLRARWQPLWESRGLTAAISRRDGTPVFGSVSDGIELSAPEMRRLPFVVAFAAGSDGAISDDSIRRRGIVAGVALACMLMIAVSYGLYRMTTRELLLARQQSDFVAAVSHEFRTPLTSMRHLLDLLTTRGVTDEGRKVHYYDLLSGETDRLRRMVETLLSFGRIDALAQVWNMEPVDVNDLVHRIGAEFSRQNGTHPLSIEVALGLPPLRGDVEALTRALTNLLENAAKYSTDDSPIRLFARLQGATVILGVQDHGIGIPRSEQGPIFEKFVRGDEAKRAGIRGLGVGLALVKRIAEAHGGRVRLTSEVGQGSTFTLVLPVTG